ncbi:MAG: hypA [Marmoricola sp.]|jgi:hydrogenase nickel incorporation protein HypA/HybF|nr:hypA [Marmoricola sp.]
MHELSIAESIVDTVLERTVDRHVSLVRIRVGRLAAVVPDALSFCFDLATSGTPLEGCRLEIQEQDARAHCRDCDTEFVLPDLFLLCACGSADLEILAGRELQVASVEVE